MALKYPSANGNWSNAANWNGGTVPVPGDDVRANGFTVTIDVDIDVLQISTVALAPAAAGGTFSVTTNRNITANINAGTTACLSSASGIIVTVIGNINGGVASAAHGISFSNVGSILNVTGNATAGSTTTGVQNGIQSSGTVNFIGNATGSAVGFGSAAINIATGGVLNLTGIVTGGSAANTSYGVQNAGNGTYNGTMTGGSAGSSVGARITAGVHTINSNCFGGTSSGSHGITLLNATATINGSCTGGNVAGSHAYSISTSTATFNGSIIGSSASSGSFAVSVADSASNVVVSQMTFGTLGSVPVSGFVKFKNAGPTVTILKANNTNQQLVDPVTTDIPIAGDVRDGVTYASGSLTGTLKVPPATAVSVGVPVDNTVGTAVITITDMGTLLASYNV
jgi:hypothetical protein